MNLSKKTISVTLDADIIEKIREEAEKNDRSISQLINTILKDFSMSDKYKNLTK
jgi:hypothetical protein